MPEKKMEQVDSEVLNKLCRGDNVATGVWMWLQQQKVIQLVPWNSDSQEMKEQEIRNKLLDELEKEILNLC
jgi:hypothetical protein